MNACQWVDPMLREWGAQRHRILTGQVRRRDGTTHFDGYAPMSFIATLREGGHTGGGHQANQHFPEVYTGHALAVWRALANAPVEIRDILNLHYVARLDEHGEVLSAAARAHLLGVCRKQYFIELAAAQYYVA